MRLTWDTERQPPSPLKGKRKGGGEKEQHERYVVISGFISKCSVVTNRKKEIK